MKFDTSIVQTRFQSPLGTIILAATGKGLAGLWFEDQRHLPRELAPTLVASRTALPPEGANFPWGGPAGNSMAPTLVTGVSSLPPEGAVSAWSGPAPKRSRPSVWPEEPDHPVLQKASQQLSEYFADQRTSFDVPLDLAYGTAFQQSVWQALLTIPRGATASYGEVSARIGKPTAVRAVGSAIGRNPVSIIVPCHRVLGAHGALTGYAGGLERKRALLRLEGVLTECVL